MRDIELIEDMKAIAEKSVGTVFRDAVSRCVGEHFRSDHYSFTRLITDAVVLNVVLNDEITPHSADKIVSYIRSQNRAFYTAVERAYFSVKDEFEKYAAAVLENASTPESSGLRPTLFIVYVISLDIAKNAHPDRQEVFLRAFSYERLISGDLPHL